MDVSFIVIAQNEERVIAKCLSSIEKISIPNTETICIDSDSSDNTVEVMFRWKDRLDNLRVFRISGDVNASIARNVGIRQARGTILFFIDSDVEISENFVSKAIEVLRDSDVGAVVGKLAELQYSENYGEVLHKIKDRNRITEMVHRKIFGGIFITRKEVAESTGAFDEDLKYQEDTDYSLRISRQYKILALPLLMGIHHTIPRHQKNRLIEWLNDKYGIYVGNVVRKNISNFSGIKELMINEKGMMSGVAFYLLLFLLSIYLPMLHVMAIALSIVFIDISQSRLRRKNLPHVLLTRYVMPFYFLFGLTFTKTDDKTYDVNELNSHHASTISFP
jgi:glycosyltransferase involved in cell wall biosynthesis